jgi:uncharacterized delta-60 repeat protein
MRIPVLLLAAAQTFVLALRGQAQNIQPDASFGTAGKVYTAFNFLGAYPGAIAVQTDQKIVVAGTYGGSVDWVVARYLPNGQLDPTFGVSGTQIYNFGFSYEECFALAVQPDGKLLLAGQANGDYALLRLLPNGQPDVTFNATGRVSFSFGAGNGSTINRLLVQPDGKILATGFAYSGTSFDFSAARFLHSGAVDAAFGVGGKVLVAMGPDRDQGRDALLQPDGKVVIVGESFDAQGNARFGICRLTSTGALDASFGTGGKTVSTRVANVDHRLNSVVRQPDGKLVAGGYAGGDFAVVRYTAAGAIDNTFGTAGYTITDFGNFQDQAYAIGLQPNGKILLAGSGYNVGMSGLLHFAIARYTTTGALDPSFGTAGKLVTIMGAYRSQIHDMAFQADGKPVFTGPSDDIQGNPPDFALLRLTSAGVTGLADDAAAGPGFQRCEVFPMPLTEASALRVALEQPGPVQGEVIDACGRRVLTFTAGQPHLTDAAEYVLPLHGLVAAPAGVYFLHLTSPQGRLTMRIAR